jgi:hypothetical protein
VTDVRRGTSLCQEFHETLDIGDSLYTKVHSDRSTTAKLIVTAYVKIYLQDKTPAFLTCSSSRWDFLQKVYLVHFIVETYTNSQKIILQIPFRGFNWRYTYLFIKLLYFYFEKYGYMQNLIVYIPIIFVLYIITINVIVIVPPK